jgi:hypothetical protein
MPASTPKECTQVRAKVVHASHTFGTKGEYRCPGYTKPK